MTPTRVTAEEILRRFAAYWPEPGRRWWSGRLMVPLSRLHDLVAGELDAVARRHGLAGAAVDVLATLRRTPPPHELRPGELADAVLLSSGGLTKALHGLHRRGLVERPDRDHADRRRRPVRLTEAGRVLIEEAMEELLAAETALLGRVLTPEQAELLAAQLRRIVAALEAGEAREGCEHGPAEWAQPRR